MSNASAMVSQPARAPRWARVEWVPLSARSFKVSNGRTSATIWAPACSQAGRPAAKMSSMTHWLNGSVTTGASSQRPMSRATSSRRSGVVAGTIRSTMVAGKRTLAATQSARPASKRPEGQEMNCPTRDLSKGPLPVRLSQGTTVSGPEPARRLGGQFRVGRRQLAGGQVVAVALLGHSQGHHLDRRVSHQRQQLWPAGPSEQRPAQRGDHSYLVAVPRPPGPSEVTCPWGAPGHQDRVQAVLSGQGVGGGGAALAHPADAPTPVPGGVGSDFGVDSLVGTVEGPQAQVDDTDRKGPRVDQWAGSPGQAVVGGQAQPLLHRCPLSLGWSCPPAPKLTLGASQLPPATRRTPGWSRAARPGLGGGGVGAGRPGPGELGAGRARRQRAWLRERRGAQLDRWGAAGLLRAAGQGLVRKEPRRHLRAGPAGAGGLPAGRPGLSALTLSKT